jgi:2'-hydroxyisoflavone reductase
MTPTWVATGFLNEQEVTLPIWEDPKGEMALLLTVDGSRAIAAGLRNRPTRETARDTIAWWRTLPAERSESTRAGPSPAREAELLELWHNAKA